jgi:hypothetical protein
MATLTEGGLAALREQAGRVRSGSMEVLEARVEARFDSDGEEYAHITLVVSRPPPGQQTWSLEDAFQVRQAVRRIAAKLGLADSHAILMTMSRGSDTEDDPDNEGGSTTGGGDPE